MTGVALEGVSKRYGGLVVVDDVSLSIAPAEFLTLLGPSGCGKTTTLRIVAGLQAPDAGRVLIASCDVTSYGTAQRNIGMVFQSLALFPHMTVGENVNFGLRMRRVPAAERAPRVRRALQIVALDHLVDRYPHQMSGGQQQRVALARALVVEPSILILDEPFGALDRKLRESMQQEVRQITRELKITSIFVTHDQEEALILSDWIAVMNKGRIEQFGRPGDIFAQPRTRFVADFMGATNIVPAKVVAKDGSAITLEACGARFWVPYNADLSAGEQLEVAIRPEWVELLAQPRTERSTFAGHVLQVIYQGAISTYTVRLATGEIVVARENNNSAVAQAEPRFAVGAPVWASWNSEAVQVLRG
jgi:spermidine/putrescine ABC transporter ATP-binding subunit